MKTTTEVALAAALALLASAPARAGAPASPLRADARIVIHERAGERVAPPPLLGVAPEESCAAELAPELPPAPEPALPAGAGGGMLAATIAIETDWELYLRYGSVEAVVAHVESVFSDIAASYRRDIGVDLEIGSLEVWAVPEDPFAVESGFLDALYELGDHWHAEHPAVPRALVHFVSGKTGIAGGIGYHGVLCRADAMVSGHWGGGYSLSGSHGVFGEHRDRFVTAHEIGHNFRAYHTHCFNDLPLPGDPAVDHCHSGEIRNDGHACHAGPVSMPPGGGSIMSYCHLLEGSYGNITLAFGGPGDFGEQSGRVIDRMRAHVETAACLAPADWTIFAGDFEAGDTGGWSDVEPEAPA